MIDLETLGKKRGCQVLSLGAVEFGPEGLGRTLYRVFARDEQESLGLHVDESTVKWWDKQSAEAREVLTAPTEPLHYCLTEFSQFCAVSAASTKLRLWGNGSDFDNQILEEVYEVAGRKMPWVFFNNRCYRTLKGLMPESKIDRSGTHHNALDDAISQAQHAVQLLHDLDLWKRLDY